MVNFTPDLLLVLAGLLVHHANTQAAQVGTSCKELSTAQTMHWSAKVQH